MLLYAKNYFLKHTKSNQNIKNGIQKKGSVVFWKRGI